MSALKQPTNTGNIKTLEELVRFVSNVFGDLQPIINGKIEFDSNFASQTVTTYFANANTDLTITHSLNKLPVNFIVVNKTKSTDIYHGTQLDTKSQVLLKSTVAGVTVTIILI